MLNTKVNQENKITNWLINSLRTKDYENIKVFFDNYIEKVSKKHEGFKEAIELYGKDSPEAEKWCKAEIFSITSINNYKVFKEVANNYSIEQLEFLSQYISQNKMLEALNDNSNEAVQLFITHQNFLKFVGHHNEAETLKGIKFFLNIYKENPELLMEDQEHTIDHYVKEVPEIRKAFIDSINELKIENQIDQNIYDYMMNKLGGLSFEFPNT